MIGHRRVALWLTVFLGLLVSLAGCSAARGTVIAPPAVVSASDGTLVSGRYTTKQGTLRWEVEFDLHADGRVTQVLSVEGTDRFAEFWRERYQLMSASPPADFAVSAVEGDNRITVKATRTYPSVEGVNESGAAELQLLDGPLFRSVVFKSETGPYDADSMVDVYGVHEQATAEDWVAFLRNAVTVGFVVNDEATGVSYRWDRTAGEIGDGLPVVIQWKEWRSLAYVGGAAVGALLLFVAYMGLFGRRHWAPADE